MITADPAERDPYPEDTAAHAERRRAAHASQLAAQNTEDQRRFRENTERASEHRPYIDGGYY